MRALGGVTVRHCIARVRAIVQCGGVLVRDGGESWIWGGASLGGEHLFIREGTRKAAKNTFLSTEGLRAAKKNSFPKGTRRTSVLSVAGALRALGAKVRHCIARVRAIECGGVLVREEESLDLGKGTSLGGEHLFIREGTRKAAKGEGPLRASEEELFSAGHRTRGAPTVGRPSGRKCRTEPNVIWRDAVQAPSLAVTVESVSWGCEDAGTGPAPAGICWDWRDVVWLDTFD